MIRAGADPKLIQTQLGHASIAITDGPTRSAAVSNSVLAGILARLTPLATDGRYQRQLSRAEPTSG